MSTVIRRVPKDWQHPKDENGRFIPLHDGSKFSNDLAHWEEHNQRWNEGFQTDFIGGWVPLEEENKNKPYSSWDGERPNPKDYTPLWSDDECTHFMAYEDISEGTPISPVFSTVEEIDHWLETTGRSLKFQKHVIKFK